MKREANAAAPSPTTTPDATTAPVLPTTSPTTRRRRAPSASRIPISLVRDLVDRPAGHERLELDPQLALGGSHHLEWPVAPGGFLERVGVAAFRRDVVHEHAAPRLLDREVPLVRQHEGELLLVVGAAACLPAVLHHHDAQIAGILA